MIHAWDWFQGVDAYYGEHLLRGVPLIVTDMSMVLERLLPKSVFTTFGTPALVDTATAAGFRRAALLLPPSTLNGTRRAPLILRSFASNFAWYQGRARW